MTPTCPGCGCILPAGEPEQRCNICGHDGCGGCIDDETGWCITCIDIHKERHQ